MDAAQHIAELPPAVPGTTPGNGTMPELSPAVPGTTPEPHDRKKAFFLFCAACNSPDIPGGHNNKISGGAFSVRSNAGLYCI